MSTDMEGTHTHTQEHTTYRNSQRSTAAHPLKYYKNVSKPVCTYSIQYIHTYSQRDWVIILAFSDPSVALGGKIKYTNLYNKRYNFCARIFVTVN